MNNPRRLSDMQQALILAALIFVAALVVQQPGTDWALYFRPAALELVALNNPHDVAGYYAVTFGLVPLIPLALLPVRISGALLSGAAIGGYYYVARRMGASVLVAGVMVANPLYTVHNLVNPNIDWLVAFGFIAPALPGAMLLLVKPQLGAGAFLYDALRKPQSALAALGAVALTVAIYGAYFLAWAQPVTGGHNLSAWPYSLPVGVVLLGYALIKRSRGAAIMATPMLSPYIGYYSLPVALLGLLPNHGRIAAAVSVAVTVVMVGWGVMTYGR